jgi:integrase
MEFIDRPTKDVQVVEQTFLTQDQVDKMRNMLKTSGDLQLETYAMFSLSTMARVNAVANTKWEQIDFENRVVNDVVEKEGYIVTLYFSEEVKQLLLSLYAKRQEDGVKCDYVFISRYGGEYDKVSTTTMHEWVKKIGEMISVPSLHCHDFRHSGSQLLKLAGMPIELISELLNHAGLDVTKKHYLRQDKAKIQSEKDKYAI